MIKDYRIGPNSRLLFKNDPQEYWVKNISPNRKEVFLTINGAQTYRKALKNIIKVDNKYVKTVHENDDTQKGMRLDKQIRVFIHNFGGPDNFKKVQQMLSDNDIEFEKKVASFSDKELTNISGLLISTNLAPKAIASSQKYKGTVEILKNEILKDFPQIKYREFKSLAEALKEVLQKKTLKENKSFTKALILNESKQFDIPVSENLRYHIVKDMALIEGIFRAGSTSHIELIKEARDLWENDFLHINDKETLKLFETTDIGKFGLFEGEMVPLDFPLVEYEILTEKEEKKTPELNKPKRGGSKKFYVYVRDPKTKNIKKVSFGQVGMSAKINDPKARQAFAKRHKCAQKKDKTKPSYWSCRLPRYAKLLGLKTTFSGYW
jgi:hypothetical protein